MTEWGSVLDKALRPNWQERTVLDCNAVGGWMSFVARCFSPRFFEITLIQSAG